jgi:hypothetical protein
MLSSVGITEKSVPVWQFVHVAVLDVGMWFAGFSWLANELKFVPWQAAQSPLAG